MHVIKIITVDITRSSQYLIVTSHVMSFSSTTIGASYTGFILSLISWRMSIYHDLSLLIY